jgi:hypothetical protein
MTIIRTILAIALMCSSVWAGNVAMLGGGVSAPTFDRASISSLVAFYPVDSVTCASACSDGDAITSWVDDKGSYDLTTSGNYPLYKTNQQNSKPTILFYPSKTLNTGGYTAVGAAYTVWIVAKFLNTDGGDLIRSSLTSGLYFKVTSSSTAAIDKYASVNVITSSSMTGVYTGYHIFIFTYSNASASPGNDGTAAIYYDGTAVAGPISNHNVILSGTGILTHPSQNVYIGEVGVCNSVLSSSDITSLYNDIKSDWGTP